MAVMTISRELGSEGSYIAERVAQTLGSHFVDKSTIEQLLIQYGFVDFKDEYNAAPGFWARFDSRKQAMVEMLNRTIQAVAHHNNAVILGRGGFVVLNGLADVLNVRIQAPLPLRIKRVMEQQNITEPDKAEAMVTESDKVQATFLESFYNVRWDAAKAFDVVIDTGKVSPNLAVTWLVQAHQALQERQANDAPTTSTIEVDPILAKAISSTLLPQP